MDVNIICNVYGSPHQVLTRVVAGKTTPSKRLCYDLDFIIRERSQMTSSAQGGWEKMTQDDRGVVGLKMTSLFYMISGENFRQFGFKKLVSL